MFGRQSGQNGNSSGSSNLVEFRAGRMNLIGKMVHPDTRKGLVYLQQNDDGLMHFCWKDRTTNKVEDDLIVFPDEYEFKRVEQCTTGRVYVLKFKTSSRRMFFWMQEPKTDKDDELCRRVNEVLNNPPSVQQRNNESNDLQYVLNNMSQQQLMQLFGGQMSGLSSLLGSMNRSGDGSLRTPTRGSSSATSLTTPENTNAPRTPSAPKLNRNKAGKTDGGGGVDGGEVGRPIDLTSAIANSEAIAEIAGDPEQAQKLAAHLPASEKDGEDKKEVIMDTINSPQFQQALTHFSSALQSAQLGPVVSQFQLSSDATAAAFSGDLEAFVKALEISESASAVLSPEDNSESTTASETKSSTAKEPTKDKETPNEKSEDNGKPANKE